MRKSPSQQGKMMNHSILSIVGLVLVSLLGSGCGPLGTPLTPLGRASRACHTNTDCALEDFCKKAQGDCEGTGRCDARVPQPAGLTGADSLIVCGCDGHTYDTPLVAASRGINLAHHGECAEGEPWRDSSTGTTLDPGFALQEALQLDRPKDSLR